MTATSGNLAICYVSDRNFLFGTLVSLCSLRRFIRDDSRKVFIFTIDIGESDIAELSSMADKLKFEIVRIDPAFLNVDADRWNKTHVPPSALGRFFFERLLPDHIDKILYIDGDTVFADDPTALLNFDPPAGKLAAAEDISYFMQFDGGTHGQRTRSYFSGLGIDGRKGYFNSGLLLSDRQTWRQITREALDFINSNLDRCLYHDQSALNAVVGDRRVRLSLTWNFQTPFRYWGVEGRVKPRVYHFTEHPKPWRGAAYPWTALKGDVERLAAELSGLKLERNLLPAGEAARIDKQNRSRRLRLWTIFLPRLLRRRRSVGALSVEAAL